LAFAPGTKGSLIVGCTGDEGAVATIVLRDFPATEPRPSNDTLMATLKSVIASEDEVAALLDALITSRHPRHGRK
jgi:hypothetical protein